MAQLVEKEGKVKLVFGAAQWVISAHAHYQTGFLVGSELRFLQSTSLKMQIATCLTFNKNNKLAACCESCILVEGFEYLAYMAYMQTFQAAYLASINKPPAYASMHNSGH